MAAAFDEVDFVIAATNPGPAFAADAADEQREDELRRLGEVQRRRPARRSAGALFGARVAGAVFPEAARRRILDQAATRFPDLVNMGALTIISNIYGNPAVSIPAGTVDGLPVGMQVLARHHADALLFDVALAVERGRRGRWWPRPWCRLGPRPRSS